MFECDLLRPLSPANGFSHQQPSSPGRDDISHGAEKVVGKLPCDHLSCLHQANYAIIFCLWIYHNFHIYCISCQGCRTSPSPSSFASASNQPSTWLLFGRPDTPAAGNILRVCPHRLTDWLLTFFRSQNWMLPSSAYFPAQVAADILATCWVGLDTPRMGKSPFPMSKVGSDFCPDFSSFNLCQMSWTEQCRMLILCFKI